MKKEESAQTKSLSSIPPSAGIVTIVGTGLIGGSFALALRDKDLTRWVIGVDTSEQNQQRALELGIANEVLPLNEAIEKSDLIVLAVPVDACEKILPSILDRITKQVVMDMGSTKTGVIEVAKDHPKRKRFVPTHPMWGTEFSGPDAAVRNAFVDKAAVLCDSENSDEDAINLVRDIYRRIGMHLIYMDATDHDLHAAYVSHISHITSFALANTVLEKEREEDAIFELASGGFESTVRLAKSNPEMWVPIFKQNRENILDVLNEHITQLRKFKSCLEKENYDYLKELIEQANGIKRILK
jgi:prephenate dehydrogenase